MYVKQGEKGKDSGAPFPQVGMQNGDKQLGKLVGDCSGCFTSWTSSRFYMQERSEKDIGASLIDIGKTQRSCALLSSTNEVQ